MQSTPARTPRIESLLARVADDPWSLTLDERRELATAFAAEQRAWAARLPALVEPPAPAREFPAFLLATPRFAHLGEAIGDATDRVALDTATADELQRFVDLFGDYASREEPADDAHRSTSDAGSVIGASHMPRRHT